MGPQRLLVLGSGVLAENVRLIETAILEFAT